MNKPDAHSNGLYTHPNTHVRVDSGKPVASSWLNGQGALVFGGASGAGAAVVRALAEAGAYVTIADSTANEGQRLMVECVGRNLRVQYIYTNLPVFRSQAEAIHYAAGFSPTATVSIIVCSAVPPPSTTQSPHFSLLSWLRTTTTDSVFPNPIPAPPTTLLDRAITATYHAVHHALHHFRQSPPLVPLQQHMNHGFQGHQRRQSLDQIAVSTSPKSATSSPRSHVANLSPTSFKTAGTSTSASAPPSHVPPPPPPPVLPLDPSTALHAHPVRHRENGETSTSPTVPMGPAGVLTIPALPSSVVQPGPGTAGTEEGQELTALPLPLPSPTSPVGALDESLHTLELMASLPPNECKHLVVLAPEAYLPPSPDDESHEDGDDSESVHDGSESSKSRAQKLQSKLPPHQLAERAAAAGLHALVDALTELCETDAMGPGISVGRVGWGEDGFEALEKNGDGGENDALLSNAADRRCVRGVMRLLCGLEKSGTDPLAGAATASSPTTASGNTLLRNPLVPATNPLNTNTDTIITQDTILLSPTLLSTSSVTDVEADADDEASGDFDADDRDEEDSSSTTSTDLILAARSVAPSALDRPGGGRGNVPALEQLREEHEEGEGDVEALPQVFSKREEEHEKFEAQAVVGKRRKDEVPVEAADTTTTPTPKERNDDAPAATKEPEKAKNSDAKADDTTATGAAGAAAKQSTEKTKLEEKHDRSVRSESEAERPKYAEARLSETADTAKPLPPLPTIRTPPPSRADDLTVGVEIDEDADAVIVEAVEEEEGEGDREGVLGKKSKGDGKEEEDMEDTNEKEAEGQNGHDRGGKVSDRDVDAAGDGNGDVAGRVSEESETF